MKKLIIAVLVFANIAVANGGERVWVLTKHPLTDEQVLALDRAESLLIMIPGISSGDIDANCKFLEQVRSRGKHDVAMFYDWEAGNLTRKVVSPTAVDPAATRLIKLCEKFQKDKKSIDLLAHSAGTVVVNKAAMEMDEKSSDVKFRHVLLLGTALSEDEPLAELKAVSQSILNVHSAFDKINRNVSGSLGSLSSLDSDVYRNLSMDHSLSGRLVRHYVFLSSDPENWLQYGTYLGTVKWPKASQEVPGEDGRAEDLHRLSMSVKKQSVEPHAAIKEMLPKWLNHSDPEIKYYAVIMAGLLKETTLGPSMKDLLKDKGTPVYLRKEIYQAFGNFEDGHYVDFLRSARKQDPDCDEVIRDVARELKRKRIAPIR